MRGKKRLKEKNIMVLKYFDFISNVLNVLLRLPSKLIQSRFDPLLILFYVILSSAVSE
jgi:hypothetical protein